MLSPVFSVFLVLGVTLDHSVTGLVHDVCFDGEGALVTSEKQHYPVKWHNFRNPSGSVRLSGQQITQKLSQGNAFWEMECKMPLSVGRIVITGTLQADTKGIRVKLLGRRRNLVKEFKPPQTKDFNVNGGVYYIRIEKSVGSLALIDIKVYGTQAPPGTACSRTARPIPKGCYSIHKLSPKDGYKIRYECSRGFRFASHFSPISHSCSKKPQTIPKCQPLKMKCDAPPKIQNSLTTIDHEKYYEQETVEYECKPGYHLIGHSVLTCKKNGSWSPQDKPKCQKVVRCPALEEPTNGGKRGANYRHGKNVSFFCYPGYQLVGPEVVRCTIQGTWSPLPNVSCKAPECPPIERDAVQNGEVYLREVGEEGYTYGNFLEVKCNNGFFLTGNKIITCTDKGSWNSALPSCSAKTGLCSAKNCGKGKECVITEKGDAICICSASLQHNCLSDILPICASNNITFWSQCHMKNYSCLNPEERFSIVRFSPCDDSPLESTARGVQRQLIHKCSFPKKVGPCKALFPRVYFDQEQNKCVPFGWGGCNENANNFETREECKRVCSELIACNRSHKFDSVLGTNLAFKRPTTPSSELAESFVDGSRVFNVLQSRSVSFSSWQVALKASSIVRKIVVWNSDKTIPWLNITVRGGNNVLASKYFNNSGACRYEWTLLPGKPVSFVGIQTAQIAALHVDEVEVIGEPNRGILINLKEENASVWQYPGNFKIGDISATADKAINGLLENNSAAEGVVNCASTALNARQQHWFQIDLKRDYFITEIALWLREGEFRRKWQTGLTVYVSNTSVTTSNGYVLPASLSSRCGVPYKTTQGKHPVFPCYFDHASRYVILSLQRQHGDGILQLCEVQVFASTCDAPPTIEHATARFTNTNVFGPAKVNYICNSGYEAATSTELSCERTGQWIQKDSGESLCKSSNSIFRNGGINGCEWLLYCRKILLGVWFYPCRNHYWIGDVYEIYNDPEPN